MRSWSSVSAPDHTRVHDYVSTHLIGGRSCITKRKKSRLLDVRNQEPTRSRAYVIERDDHDDRPSSHVALRLLTVSRQRKTSPAVARDFHLSSIEDIVSLNETAINTGSRALPSSTDRGYSKEPIRRTYRFPRRESRE